MVSNNKLLKMKAGFLLLVICSLICVGSSQPGAKKKYQQEVRTRTSPPTTSSSATSKTSASNGKSQGDFKINIVDPTNTQQQASAASSSTTGSSGASSTPSKDHNKITCPKCPASSNLVKVALEKFWENDLISAYSCACNALLIKSNDDMAKAILYSLRPAKSTFPQDFDLNTFEPPSSDRTSLKTWEILGPMNIGKLELDADPTFLFNEFHNSFGRHQHSYGFQYFDPIAFILSMSSENTTVYSDMVSEGKIEWRKISAKNTGQIDIQFNLPWNDLAQGLSSSSVLEYQAWTRTVAHIKASGSYIFECQGPHTAYIRNDNTTKVLVGDVYRNQQIKASVDLKAGVVGIVIPHRVVVQSAFACSLYPAGNSIIAYPAQSVPNAIEFPSSPGKGLLLSTVFAIPVHNVFSHSITVEFGIEKPIGQEGDFFIREAKHLSDTSPGAVHTTIAPGQTISIPLELTSTNLGSDNTQSTTTTAASTVLYVACKENRPFHVILNPSKGSALKVPIEFKCRKWTQSFMISYVDHDDAVAEAAVILPLDFHTSSYKSHLSSLLGVNNNKQTNSNSRTFNNKKKKENIKDIESISNTCDASIDGTCTVSMFNTSNKVYTIETYGYPVLLTLHGSGIPASNHADAYKMMPSGWKDYLFGVEGYYVLAPSRFGAHNWEGVGYLSAITALKSLYYLINNRIIKIYNKLLPKVYLENGIIAGHSMGGHGAWITAMNSPNRFTCAIPGAGWIKKEEYSNSNEFFTMIDISSSFTDPDLKRILERSLSEYHVDRLINNMQSMKVHIRVGTHDNTVHPWYSRRMHRLLLQNNIYSILEEPLGKQHWWWDTNHENDGGVVNDEVMRHFYISCLNNHYAQTVLLFNYSTFMETTTTNKTSSSSSFGNDNDSKDDINKPFKFREWLIDHIQSSMATTSDTSSELSKPQPSTDTTTTESSPSSLNNQKKMIPIDSNSLLLKHDCERNLKLSLINPSQHEGYCGIQILQQYRTLQLSSIDIYCNQYLPSSKIGTTTQSNDNDDRKYKICHITTMNVKRFTIDYVNFGTTLYDVNELYINNHPIDISQSKGNINNIAVSPIHICQSYHQLSHFCKESIIHPLKEKTLITYGPIRQVYSRPFYIVYGTPQNQILRLAMRDYAVYLGNSLYTSHHCYVQVLSDLEFRSGNYMKKSIVSNMMFIGDMNTNKLLRAILLASNSTTSTINNNKQSNSNSKVITIQARIPESLELLGYVDDRENTQLGQRRRTRHGDKIDDDEDVENMSEQGFRIANYTFAGRDEGLLFTFPLYRPNNQDISSASKVYQREEDRLQQSGAALGVCIHANTAEGYIHLSRVAWPVIPPMVRAPFANYIPDFMVIGKDIWGKGPGGVQLAGYWTSDWTFDPADAYIGGHLLK